MLRLETGVHSNVGGLSSLRSWKPCARQENRGVPNASVETAKLERAVSRSRSLVRVGRELVYHAQVVTHAMVVLKPRPAATHLVREERLHFEPGLPVRTAT